MATIAELEVMLVTNINKFKSGLNSAKSELSGFEGHSKSSISRMEQHWLNSITRIAAAYVGIRAAWNFLRENIQDGLDEISYAIKSELAPELEGLNKKLSELAHSDFPARVAAGLKMIWYNARGVYDEFKALYLTFTGNLEAARQADTESSEAFRKARESFDVMWNGTNKLNTDWSKYKETVKETKKEINALKESYRSLTDQYLEYHSQEQRQKDLASGTIRAARPSELLTYPQTLSPAMNTSHPSSLPSRNPEDVGSTRAISITNNITIENLNSTDAAQVIAQKVAEATAMGYNQTGFKPSLHGS